MKENKIIDSYLRTQVLKQVHKETGFSVGKIRKTLLSAGIELDSERTQEINRLYTLGLSIEDIATRLEILPKTVTSHLPYIKVPYGQENKSNNAKNIEKCRKKKLL